MEVSVNGTIKQTVEVDVADVIKTMESYLNFDNERGGFVKVKNGELIKFTDISYHGSPYYDETLISDNPNWVKLYESINCIKDFLEHRDEPQWQKIVNEKNNIDRTMDSFQRKFNKQFEKAQKTTKYRSVENNFEEEL